MRVVVGIGLVVLCVGIGPGETRAGDDPPAPVKDPAAVPFADQVGQAIDRGVAWVAGEARRVRLGKVSCATWGVAGNHDSYGNQGPWRGYPAGPTALALYTLLKCGVPPDHELIEAGFRWLKTPHPYDDALDRGTWGPRMGGTVVHRLPADPYEAPLLALAITARYDVAKPSQASREAAREGRTRIRDKEDAAWLRDLVDGMVRGQSGGGWGYSRVEGQPRGEDLSVSQVTALALLAAHRAGVSIDSGVWLALIEFTLGHQEADGPKHASAADPTQDPRYASAPDRARGFCYLKGSPVANEARATGSMTSCGVANLALAREVLLGGKLPARWRAEGFEGRIEAGMRDGVAWLDRNWDVAQNPGGGGYHTYYLYGIERAMDLLGKNLVGKHLWYEEGARRLLDTQKRGRVPKVLLPGGGEVEGGHWDTGSTIDTPRQLIDTCFALLFLRRATLHRVAAVTGK